MYARYLCSRDALGLKAEQPVGQARRATIGYLVYKIKLILPNSIILLTSLLPCLKDRDFNVDFINDRISILNNVINEICIERKDCKYFNIHTMFTNFILQGLSQQYYKYDGLHMSYLGITMVNKNP